jgi:hypothetical protein
MKLTGSELWKAMRQDPSKWVETTDEMYYEMLTVLPPARFTQRSFLMGDPFRTDSDGNKVYACFEYRQGGYFARFMTEQQFEKIRPVST